MYNYEIITNIKNSFPFLKLIFVIFNTFLLKMSKLPADCINEIFEYLEDDDDSLYSCLLVNRFWCKISVRILWRNIRNYNTLINCLPSESKEILYKNEINFSTLKPPTFNYASFCKSLSVYEVNHN